MKDFGEATYMLGILIYRDRSKNLFGLSQSMYIDTIVKRFGMQDSKKGFIPMRHGVQISKKQSPKTPEDKALMQRITYASAIGSIMYAMICTWPYVAYALSVTNRFQADPGEKHWEAVKCILKYLRRTKDLFLVYGEEELKLKGYTDSSFQSDPDDSKSTSRFLFTLNGGAFSWKSSKQTTTTDSRTEAEYIATSDFSKEALWLKKFITNLDVIPSILDPIPVLCNNNGAIA